MSTAPIVMTHESRMWLTGCFVALGSLALLGLALGLFVLAVFFRSLATTRRNRNRNNVPGGPR